MSRVACHPSATCEKKREKSSRGSDIKRSESLFGNIAVPEYQLWIGCADRADIIIREVLEFCSRLNAPVGFPALFIIHIVAHRTDIAGGPPFVKSPFTDPPLSLLAADRADVAVWQIVEGCSGGDAVMGFTPEGGVNVPAKPAPVAGHVCFTFFRRCLFYGFLPCCRHFF